MNEQISAIEAEITRLKQDNLKQKNTIEESSLDHERQIDALVSDVITIIDAFEKAEVKVKEMGLTEDENAQKAIKRMLQPKKMALSVWANVAIPMNVRRLPISA